MTLGMCGPLTDLYNHVTRFTLALCWLLDCFGDVKTSSRRVDLIEDHRERETVISKINGTGNGNENYVPFFL